MTISASNRTAESDMLSRSLKLYRDLYEALQVRIAILQSQITEEDADCKKSVDAVKSHHRALQTVLDLEASLGKRKEYSAEGAGVELDLHAAREEIAARLAVWHAER